MQFKDEELQAEIQRLTNRPNLDLPQVKSLHNWLEVKRQAKQACRVVGDARTGKTVACDNYRLRHKPIQEPGKLPIVPVVYIQVPEECSSKELFWNILEYLKYQITKGTVAELRERTMRALKNCGVEMVIIDEADNFKLKTLADVRHIYDELKIPVVLVGTIRLDTLIGRDDRVDKRFKACHRFGKLVGEEFRRTVDIWEKMILKLPVASNLISKSKLELLRESTGGCIGLLDEILRDAGIRSLNKGLPKIDLDTLKEVTTEYQR